MNYVLVWLVTWLLVYNGCNILTSLRPHRYLLAFSWENTIPLVPPMLLAYVSLYPMVALAIIRSQGERRKALCHQMTLGTLIAGVIFLLFPAQLSFARLPVAGIWSMGYEILHAVDLPHNLFPSLHVTYATLCSISLLGNLKSTAAKSLVYLWLGIIVLSVVLTHQHHVVDILGGWMVAFPVNRFLLRTQMRNAHQNGN